MLAKPIFLTFGLAVGFLLPALGQQPQISAKSSGAKVDKVALEQFIRYTEGYTPMVKITIDDPVSTPFKGFERLPVHLGLGQQTLVKQYYVAENGQIVNGTLWNTSESPFAENLQRLPHDGPSFGPDDPKVTMVVFSDFQCPYCRKFAHTMRDVIARKYPNDVRVEFEDYPIESIHKWAEQASEAGRCIGDGKAPAFWAFHDWIFEHQGEITADNLQEKAGDFAKTQELDETKVRACIASHSMAPKVKAALKAGQELEVQQTPTCFINGRLVSGALEPDNLDAIIQLELNRPPQVPGPGRGKGPEAKMLKP